jgi:hypothetical protein
MSEFFEPPPPAPESPAWHEQPEWLGPPENVVGVSVPLDLTLARTDKLALAVPAATAYPNGIVFDVVLLLREQVRDPFEWHPFHPVNEGGELSPKILRLGVQFADGQKATSLGRPFLPHDPAELPSGPVLMPRGGGGGGRRWDVSFWLWPLPPPGPLTLVCEWPAREIALTRVEVDNRRLLDASQRAAPLWPDGGGAGGGGGFTNVSFIREG